MRIALLIAVLAPGLAAAQTPLVWKFVPGDVFSYERESKDHQATAIKGQTLKQEIHSTWVYRFEVAKADGGSASLRMTIERASVQHSTGPATVENKPLEKLKGAAFDLVVSPRGEILSFAGYDKAVARVVGDKRDDLVKAFRQQYTESALRQEIQQTLAMLPREAPAEGTRWQTEPATLVAPPLGQFLTVTTGAHRGLDRAGHHLLEAALSGKFERLDPPADFFRVVGGSLSLERGQWTCAFDAAAGRVVRQKLLLEVSGELTIEVVGATTPVEIRLRREVATRLLPRTKE